MAISTFEADEIVARANVNQRINQANAYFPVSVANGGTGQTSLSSGHVLLGNGTSGITSTATLPISKGGTGATTATSARTSLAVYRETVLYSNDSGSTNTITLSSSIQNFVAIEIMTRNNDNRRMSMKFRVNATVPVIALMSSTVYDYATNTPAISLKCSNIRISGATITWQEQASCDLRNTAYTSAASQVKIYRVIGISY